MPEIISRKVGRVFCKTLLVATAIFGAYFPQPEGFLSLPGIDTAHAATTSSNSFVSPLSSYFNLFKTTLQEKARTASQSIHERLMTASKTYSNATEKAGLTLDLGIYTAVDSLTSLVTDSKDAVSETGSVV